MSDAQIFQVLSVYYIAVGIGMLANRQYYKKIFEEFVERTSILFIGGLIAFGVGYLLVAFHNTWTKDLSVIITIVGWLALVKGILIFICPKLMIAVTKTIMGKEKNLMIRVVVIVIFGLLFSFLGFCPKSPI
ncbi:MAG: hypothetical protein ACYTE5_00750 [Planctomycetota bacterium]|jgi:hypothetical protein